MESKGGVAAIVCDTTGNAVRQWYCYTYLAIGGYFGRVTKDVPLQKALGLQNALWLGPSFAFKIQEPSRKENASGAVFSFQKASARIASSKNSKCCMGVLCKLATKMAIPQFVQSRLWGAESNPCDDEISTILFIWLCIQCFMLFLRRTSAQKGQNYGYCHPQSITRIKDILLIIFCLVKTTIT